VHARKYVRNFALIADVERAEELYLCRLEIAEHAGVVNAAGGVRVNEANSRLPAKWVWDRRHRCAPWMAAEIGVSPGMVDRDRAKNPELTKIRRRVGVIWLAE
jgi:hypothetical protein